MDQQNKKEPTIAKKMNNFPPVVLEDNDVTQVEVIRVPENEATDEIETTDSSDATDAFEHTPRYNWTCFFLG